jgi:hypothetical protein
MQTIRPIPATHKHRLQKHPTHKLPRLAIHKNLNLQTPTNILTNRITLQLYHH